MAFVARDKALSEDPNKVYTEDALPKLAPRSSAPAPHEKQASFKSEFELTGEVLGVGMGGVVMGAVHRESRKRVAVKSFKLEELSRRAQLDLDREIQTQFSIDHPNVAKVEAICKSDRRLRLVMELLEGGDVFDHLEETEGSISEAQTARVIRQLLEAVAHLHDMGIVHRDIKLENLVYESKKRDKVKLIDFGLCSRWAEGKKPLRRSCGTLAYLPPEMTRGAYTNKADLWCVGTAAYTMLTGEKLLRDENWNPVFTQTLGRLSKGAKQFVEALLHPDPDRRPSAREALQHFWLREALRSFTTDTQCPLTGDNLDSHHPGPVSAASSASSWSSKYSTISMSISANFCRHLLSRNSSDAGPRLKTAVESFPAGLYRQSHEGAGGWRSEPPAPSLAKKSFWRNPMPSMTSGSNRVSALVASLRGKSKGASRVSPEAQVCQPMSMSAHRNKHGMHGLQCLTTDW
jgi:serine/threonine protein kinase